MRKDEGMKSHKLFHEKQWALSSTCCRNLMKYLLLEQILDTPQASD